MRNDNEIKIGIVEYWNEQKSFGFIRDCTDLPNGKPSLFSFFFHKYNKINLNQEILKGDKVQFGTMYDKKNGKLRACNVKKVI
jgi:cold shock CspA family protein